MKAIVITGTSTGIGYATAKYCIGHGITVFGSVRNEKDANKLEKELGSQHFIPIVFDVTDETIVKAGAEKVKIKLQGKKLWGLINNAGIVVPGPLLYMSIADFRKQLEVNLVGQLIVTKAFAPLLGTDPALEGKPGRIINISSVAGKRALPFLTAYAISKHGLEAFSEGLRRECMPFGIDVICLGPGAIKTPIWEKAEKEEFSDEVKHSVYRKAILKLPELTTKIEKNALPVEKVAELIFSILEKKHPKVRYSIEPYKFASWIMINLLPKRWLDKLIARKFKLITK